MVYLYISEFSVFWGLALFGFWIARVITLLEEDALSGGGSTPTIWKMVSLVGESTALTSSCPSQGQFSQLEKEYLWKRETLRRLSVDSWMSSKVCAPLSSSPPLPLVQAMIQLSSGLG